MEFGHSELLSEKIEEGRYSSSLLCELGPNVIPHDSLLGETLNEWSDIFGRDRSCILSRLYVLFYKFVAIGHLLEMDKNLREPIPG